MAKYLISFPSAAMVVPDGEWEAVSRDAHAVIDEAKAAGVYVFGGGIDENVPPALVSADGAVAEGAIRGRPRSTAASPYSNCPRATTPSRGLRASLKPVAAPRSCASSASTRSLEGGTEIAQTVRPNKSFKPKPRREAVSFRRSAATFDGVGSRCQHRRRYHASSDRVYVQGGKASCHLQSSGEGRRTCLCLRHRSH
ncbi:MAG: hypothetical protein BroJett011_17420 [Chloroflexota bacterium]|nr:MAG: hypothetical protein BroJett011_17420 [Chloroflexota bacterium]